MMMLLFWSPDFPKTDRQAFAKLLNVELRKIWSKWNSYHNLQSGKVTKGLLTDYTKMILTSQVIRELLAFGFRPFSINPAGTSLVEERTGFIFVQLVFGFVTFAR